MGAITSILSKVIKIKAILIYSLATTPWADIPDKLLQENHAPFLNTH